MSQTNGQQQLFHTVVRRKVIFYCLLSKLKMYYVLGYFHWPHQVLINAWLVKTRNNLNRNFLIICYRPKQHILLWHKEIQQHTRNVIDIHQFGNPCKAICKAEDPANHRGSSNPQMKKTELLWIFPGVGSLTKLLKVNISSSRIQKNNSEKQLTHHRSV